MGPGGEGVFRKDWPKWIRSGMKRKRLSVGSCGRGEGSEQDAPVAELLRRLGIPEQIFYYWKKVYEGTLSRAKRGSSNSSTRRARRSNAWWQICPR